MKRCAEHGGRAGVFVAAALIAGVVGLAGPVSSAHAASVVPPINPGGLATVSAHLAGWSQPHGRVVSRSARGEKGVYILVIKLRDDKNNPVTGGVANMLNVKTGAAVGPNLYPDSRGRFTFRINPSMRHKLGKVSMSFQFVGGSEYRPLESKRAWSFKVVK